MALHYLTVQDILWINLQVTKKVGRFNYARLEEACFYQYAYGDSKTLVPQAGRFLSGFMRMHPFDEGNEATAFIATLTFLMINGRSTILEGDEAYNWFNRAQAKGNEGVAAIEEMSRHEEDEHHALIPDIRATVKCILQMHSETISRLTQKVA